MTTQNVAILTESAAGRRALRGSAWQNYLLSRLGGLLLALVLLVVATFLIVPLLPGDPATAILGTQATPAAIAELHERLNLDAPLWVRFWDYVAGLLHLDLGVSFRYSVPVTTIIADKIPYTLGLALPAILIVVLVAVPVGLMVGVLTRGGRNAPLSVIFSAVAGFLASIPGYVIATILILVFAIWLAVLPPGGATSALSAVLPTMALAIGPTCAVARVVRQETQTIIQQDYMRTARGHRLTAARLYLVHALPNLLASTLTLCALILASIIGGTVIVENVFNYPGIGKEIVQAIIYKDYPVVQGIILVIGAIAIVVNLVIDLTLAVVDPRTLGGAHS